MKKTRKSLWLSALSLCLCAMMLMGTTFAWFTDSVVNKDNRIEAGTLQVELWKKGLTESADQWKNITESTEPVFNYNKWEPGYSTGATLEVRNAGTLAIKYELELQKVVTTGGIENVIDVYVNGENKGTLADFMNGENLFEETLLKAEQFGKEIKVELRMKKDADNKYQGKTATFDILLKATQAQDEEDGFGSNEYDKDALWPVVVSATDDAKENGAALLKAIENAPEKSIITLEDGTYDVTGTVSNAEGSLLTITTKGLTIKGDGNVIIQALTSSGSNQNTITVDADDVTLEGLTIMPIQGVNGHSNAYNKALEVRSGATTFTLRNCTFVENNTEGTNPKGYAGQVSLNPSKDADASTILVEGCTFNGAVLDARCGFTAKNNVFNGVSPVHEVAVRIRYQTNGSTNTETATVKMENNEFNSIPLNQFAIQSIQGYELILNENAFAGNGYKVKMVKDNQKDSFDGTVVIDDTVQSFTALNNVSNQWDGDTRVITTFSVDKDMILNPNNVASGDIIIDYYSYASGTSPRTRYSTKNNLWSGYITAMDGNNTKYGRGLENNTNYQETLPTGKSVGTMTNKDWVSSNRGNLTIDVIAVTADGVGYCVQTKY